jgi:hypothetical protein
MQGDFTYLPTPEEYRSVTGVLLQQGRVLMDSDWNEQAAVVRDQHENLARALIGWHGGFDNGFSLAGNQAPVPAGLTLAVGSYYVDGVRCFNSRPRRYLIREQDLDANNKDDHWVGAQIGPAGDQAKFASLVAWRRVAAAAHEDRLIDPALGGIDTSAREQIRWELRFTPRLPDAPKLTDCHYRQRQPIAPLTVAEIGAVATDRPGDGPCEGSAPLSEHRGENQLYRIEVHERSGDDVYVKWSRDNGAAVFAVRPDSLTCGNQEPEDEVVQLDTVTFALVSPPRDDRFLPREGDWVEIEEDDRPPAGIPSELGASTSPRRLRQVNSYDPYSAVVTLEHDPNAPKVTYNAAGPSLVMRRWDQPPKKPEQGAPSNDPPGLVKFVRAQTTFELELDGLRVSLNESNIAAPQPGDYWQIRLRRGRRPPEAVPLRRMWFAWAPLASFKVFEGVNGPVIAELTNLRRAIRAVACPQVAGDMAFLPPAAPSSTSFAAAFHDHETPTANLRDVLLPEGVAAVRNASQGARELARRIPASRLNAEVTSPRLRRWLATAVVGEIAGVSTEEFVDRILRAPHAWGERKTLERESLEVHRLACAVCARLEAAARPELARLWA